MPFFWKKNNKNIIRSKENEISLILGQLGINLQGRTVLDVGCNTGENCSRMRELGATVYGVEPQKAYLQTAIKKKYLTNKQAFLSKVQEIPEQFNNSFDVITVWLMCVPPAEYTNFLDAVARLLNPNGLTVISFFNPLLVAGKASVKAILEKQFLECVEYSGQEVNKYVFLLRKPKIHRESCQLKIN